MTLYSLWVQYYYLGYSRGLDFFNEERKATYIQHDFT